MNLFWLLVLAHFVADFPLQTDTIYSYKKRSGWGVIPHVTISILVMVILALPYLKIGMFWLALVILTLIHGFLDRAKIILTQRYLQDNLLLFGLDQGLHLLSIWLITRVFFDFPIPDVEMRYINYFYLNNKLIIIFTGMIFSVFGGAVIIHYLRLMVKSSNPNHEIPFPAIKLRAIGYLERFIATLGIIVGGWLYFLTLLAFLPRIVLQWNKGKGKREFLLFNLVVGIITSIVTGFVVRKLIS